MSEGTDVKGCESIDIHDVRNKLDEKKDINVSKKI
jgi:hypothetical protein